MMKKSSFLVALLFFVFIISCKKKKVVVMFGRQGMWRKITAVASSIKLQLNQIINVNEINRIITTSSYFLAFWPDPRLKWDPSSYENITFVNIQANKLWLPDLFVLNTADSNGFISSAITNTNLAYVLSDGAVFINIGLINLNTRCSLDVTKVFLFSNFTTVKTRFYRLGGKLEHSRIPPWRYNSKARFLFHEFIYITLVL